jgi:hypothetical protein
VSASSVWGGSAADTLVSSQLPNAQIVGVCDANPERCRNIYGFTSAKTFSDFPALDTLAESARTSIPTEVIRN